MHRKNQMKISNSLTFQNFCIIIDVEPGTCIYWLYAQVQVSDFINSNFKIHTEKLNYRAPRTFGKSRQRGIKAEICE